MPESTKHRLTVGFRKSVGDHKIIFSLQKSVPYLSFTCPVSPSLNWKIVSSPWVLRLLKFGHFGSCQIDKILRDDKAKSRWCCLFSAGERKGTLDWKSTAKETRINIVPFRYRVFHEWPQVGRVRSDLGEVLPLMAPGIPKLLSPGFVPPWSMLPCAPSHLALAVLLSLRSWSVLCQTQFYPPTSQTVLLLQLENLRFRRTRYGEVRYLE